jgi:hypothetical protein
MPPAVGSTGRLKGGQILRGSFVYLDQGRSTVAGSPLPFSRSPRRSPPLARCPALALGQRLPHIPVAPCEPEIKPDRVLDNRRREAMSELIHAGSLPCRATRSNPVSVTLPDGCRR